MALAQDTRLKQMMVYRLEEQLRVISQDDPYSQILASLSRCVQSLLVPSKERGHDGSGDATTINPFVNLDELLLDAPRAQNTPSREKLLVLLADSLSVVFSTIDNLKPGPVSRSYLDSVVEEEQALANASSSASNVISQLTDTAYTESQNTASGIVSSVSASAVSSTFTAPVVTPTAAPAQPQWGQQQQAAAPVQTPAASFGIQFANQPNAGFGNQPSAPSFGTAPQQQQMFNQPAAQPQQQFNQPPAAQQQTAPSFVAQPQPQQFNQPAAQPQQQFNQPPAPQQQTASSFGDQAAPQQQFNQAPGNATGMPSFGTKSKSLNEVLPQQQFQAPEQAAPMQQPAAQQQFQNVPSQAFRFGTQQQPAAPQQQFQSAPAQSSGFGSQQQQFQNAPSQAPSFGTRGSSNLSEQQQPVAPQQQFQSAPAQAPSFGTQQPQFQNAPSQAPSFGTPQQQPAAPQQQFQNAPTQAPAFGTQQQFQATPSQAPSFGTQQQPQFQTAPAPAPGFGTQPQPVAPQQQLFQTASSQPTTATSSMNVTSSNGSQMTSTVETDGGAGGDNYKLPVKIPVPQSSPTPTEEDDDVKLYNWDDYNPAPSNFGKHVLPPAGRGGFGGDRGGRGGGFSGGRGGAGGGFDGGRGGARGGGFTGGRGGGFDGARGGGFRGRGSF